MTSPSDIGSFSSSSFGPRYTTFGPNEFRGTSVLSSPRYKELDRRQSYYDCTQHDGKGYDFDGRILTLPGPGALVTSTQALISSQVAPFYVPLKARRPSAPYRLGRVITNAFTNMVFGNQRFPSLRVDGDSDTADFSQQLIKSTRLGSKMIRARNIGGAVGTVGLSWCYDRKGRPRVEVHNGKFLYVHEWDDREELIPSWVTEVFLTGKDVWDGVKKKFLRKWFWQRRDWSEEADVSFVEVEYQPNREPVWVIDDENSTKHDDGFCHFSWIQNIPTEEIDGLPDYDGLYELFDTLDILLSVITKGAVLNLDPTLVLKMDPDILGTMGIKKGSDQALAVGEEGGAEYLELNGTSLESGVKLFNEKRRGALETAQCVVLDPSESVGPDVSSVAQRQKYGPMTARCEIFRDQYGDGMKRILEQMTEVARQKVGTTVQVPRVDDQGNPVPQTAEDGSPMVDEQGKPVQAQDDAKMAVNLPPKVVRMPKKDPDGNPVMGDDGKPVEDVQRVPHVPGEGGELEWVWPPYFQSTPADQSQAITTLSAAAGGKPVLSQQTAVEQASNVYGVEPEQEWARVQKDTKEDADRQAEQAKAFGEQGDFGGGKVGGEKDLPPGAKPKPPGGRFGGSAAPFGKKGDDQPPQGEGEA